MPTVEENARAKIRQAVRLSVYPGFYVRHTMPYTSWNCVVVCDTCEVRGAYEDIPTSRPCRFCGADRELLEEKIGRWVKIKQPWWKLFAKKRGYWEMKS